MSSSSRNPQIEPKDFTEQLKAKSRGRRATAKNLQGAMAMGYPVRNDLAPALALVEIPIDALRSPFRKVRALDEAHVQAIVRSISVLGFCAPILIGADNVILDGQSRIEAARKLGLLRVPCIQVGHLTKTE
jgi:hypothetical protein